MQKKLSFHQFTNRRSKWKLTDEFSFKRIMEEWGLNIFTQTAQEDILRGPYHIIFNNYLLAKYFHYRHTFCYPPSEYIPSKRIERDWRTWEARWGDPCSLLLSPLLPCYPGLTAPAAPASPRTPEPGRAEPAQAQRSSNRWRKFLILAFAFKPGK